MASTAVVMGGMAVWMRRLGRYALPLLGGLGLMLPAGVAVSAGPGATAAQTQPVQEARSVAEWLQRIHGASRKRSYVGTLVVANGSTMAAARIWHVCDGQQQMERIETLTGAPRTTIRRNDQVITFDRANGRAVLEQREALSLFPDLLKTPRTQLGKFYVAQPRGSARIAGMEADIVEFLPRDAWRFGYRVWAERGTGLVLQLQTLGAQGEVLEQVAFSELHMDAPVSMEALAQAMADTRGYKVFKPVVTKTQPEAQGWRLTAEVPGFETMSCQTQAEPADVQGGTPSQTLQWVLSDGLASVSLFIELRTASGDGAADPVTAQGATHAVVRQLGEYRVTAMGEVPPRTLRHLLGGLARAP